MTVWPTRLTADNLAATQKAIAASGNDGSGADSKAELQALVNSINKAIKTISDAAQANNATASTPATYAAGGMKGVDAGNNYAGIVSSFAQSFFMF